MRSGRTWLFWTVTWNMEVCGIGLCRCLRFGIVGIIATVGQLKIFKICLRTIGGRFTGRTSMWIFDFGDIKAKDCVAGNGGKGKKETSHVPIFQMTNPISVAQSVFCFLALTFHSIGFFWEEPADWRKTACATGIFGLSWRSLRGLLLLQKISANGLVAQLVEQRPFKPLVQGSSPCQPTRLAPQSYSA